MGIRTLVVNDAHAQLDQLDEHGPFFRRVVVRVLDVLKVSFARLVKRAAFVVNEDDDD